MTMLPRHVTLRNTAISPVGLDVSPRHVRAAQVVRSGRNWRVIRLNEWSKRENEAGTHHPEGFVSRVRRAMQQAEYQGRRVAAGLSVPEVQIYPLEISARSDNGNGQEFTQAVLWELQRVVTIPLDNAAVSYWRTPGPSASRTSAIGVAADREQVDAVATLADALGFDCDRVDATACALARLGAVVRRRPDVDRHGVWGVLDVGHRLQRLVLCVDECPVLVRSLGQGGQGWTEALANSLGLSPDAAEMHKLDHGIAPAAMSGSGDEPAAHNAEIARIIQNVLHADLGVAVNEIERSYEYVMRCYPERHPSELLLVGGGAAMKGLDRHLSQELGIDVLRLEDALSRPGTPVTLENLDLHGPLGRFAGAIGLAIDAEGQQ
jgi:Tfp pilus assembly PilM family ATPase